MCSVGAGRFTSTAVTISTIAAIAISNVAERASRTPKGRLLHSDEVSRLLHYVLYVDEGTLTNTVVHLNCGEFAR